MYYKLHLLQLHFGAALLKKERELLFTALLHLVDKFGLLNTEMRQKRETIFVELNSMLIRTLGGTNGSIRLGQILSFVQITMVKFVQIFVIHGPGNNFSDS